MILCFRSSKPFNDCPLCRQNTYVLSDHVGPILSNRKQGQRECENVYQICASLRNVLSVFYYVGVPFKEGCYIVLWLTLFSSPYIMSVIIYQTLAFHWPLSP